MTTRQGELQPDPIAAKESVRMWNIRDKRQVEISLRANDKCECCFNHANRWQGHLHHRNGDYVDLNHTNLLWLCRDCYIKVNGMSSELIPRITIAGLIAELKESA